MTNDLEKQFFDTFGIEPITGCKHIWNGGTRESIITCIERCENYSKREECKQFITIYPKITDRILLELICIYLDYRVLTTQISIKDLKKTVLEGLIELHQQYNLMA